MNLNNPKFYFVCKHCGAKISSFEEWFNNNQSCPKCGTNWVDVKYHQANEDILDLIHSKEKPDSLWQYFDFLPLLDRKNIVTEGEGVIPVENWEFLQKYAKDKYGVNCEVVAYRNDLNPGTGTFKDVAAGVAASVLKENNINQYCVASTGNIATAFAHYLSLAGINIAVFIPNDALKAHEATISSYGQRVFRAQGDYAFAKQLAAAYSKKYNILMSGGNTDPMRVEAKKTMVFEWMRQTGKLPNVYIQALSGGTGPIAIDKAVDDLSSIKDKPVLPRFLMIQPSACDPMTIAYQKAKENNFPKGWESDYPVLDNPITKVPTLATGNPKTYPIISSLVKKSHGDIISFDEDKMIDIARLVSFEKTIKIGPAAAVAVGGFFDALRKNLIKEGELVMINVGEGIARAPEFLEEMIYSSVNISSLDECTPPERMDYQNDLWQKLD